MATIKDEGTTKVLLAEDRTFSPPEEFSFNTNVHHWMTAHGMKTEEELRTWADENPERFWEEMISEAGVSIRGYSKVLDWKPPYAKFFAGAKYNIVLDALDKHKDKDKVAYYWQGEPTSDEGAALEEQVLTYADLYREVNHLANAFKILGIKKGDRVGIYLPMIPQLPIAMLACAKIGAIHSVVFSGFSAIALRERVIDTDAKALITCDGFYRRGNVVNLKAQVDEAVSGAPSVRHVIVYRRLPEDVLPKNEIKWYPGDPEYPLERRDHWWDDLISKTRDFLPQVGLNVDECETEVGDTEDPLYILYTSGTTGKPKGVIHVHGGYALATSLTLKWVFDLKESDVWWCAADIGWVTGHSYIVYAPLILGVSSIMYEGAPDWPDAGRFWSIVDRYKATVFYTSPTAIRLLMKYGDKWPRLHDLSSLRLLGTVGEPINPEAWMWYFGNIGKGRRLPIMDTWWQTETGNFVIAPLPISTLKPGSATRPLPGFKADVYDEKGNSVKPGAGGYLVLTQPWPGMLRGLYKAPDRYAIGYWSKYLGTYFSGDLCRRDEDGYFWIQGRCDDVLSIAGHRIGNSEVESALVTHPSVVEAAVVGIPHEIKGETIVAFVVLRHGEEPGQHLEEELKRHVAREIGKIVRPEEIHFAPDVPKTRSGKIMRRVVKKVRLGEEPGDISTLANPEAVDRIREILESKSEFPILP
ncbi:MAG: acetate--CoA ligase [Proteobacteria bacterium]|nr:acetate--CoA ligase [Pseudomonadota bacterium]